MSEQQYTTPEKPAGYRSYPENLRYYADHFDKYRMWADSGMTRAMRQSAEDVETLRARVTELEARIEEAEKQEPYEWKVEHHDGSASRTRRLTSRSAVDNHVAAGWTATPLYIRPLPAPVAAVPDDDEIEAIASCLEDDAAHLRGEGFDDIPDNMDEAAALIRRLPAPAAQAVADDVVRDAELWRLIRERGAYWAGPYAAWLVRLPYAETFEQAADAMLAAKAKGE